MSEETKQPFETWGLVEVMGHRRFAGLVSEQIVAGAAFVRIDVPQGGQRMAFTKLIGAGSIYAITPTSEEVARKLAEQYYERPVEIYSPSVHQSLPFAPMADYDED